MTLLLLRNKSRNIIKTGTPGTAQAISFSATCSKCSISAATKVVHIAAGAFIPAKLKGQVKHIENTAKRAEDVLPSHLKCMCLTVQM